MLGRQVAATLPTSFVARLAYRSTHARVCIRSAPAAQWRLYATGGTSESGATKTLKPKTSAKKPVAKDKTAAAQKKADAKKAKAAKEREKKAAARTRLAESKAKKAAHAKAVKARRTERERNAKKAQDPRHLKVSALQPPKLNIVSGWSAFTTSEAKPKPEGVDNQVWFAQHSKEKAAKWRSLSQTERDQYAKQAHDTNARSRAAFSEWVKSQDPAAIEKANTARAKLRKLGVRGNWQRIPTGTAPTKRANGYIAFFTEQVRGRKLPTDQRGPDLAREVTARWRALSDAEKETYKRIAQNEVTQSAGSSPEPQFASASA